MCAMSLAESLAGTWLDAGIAGKSPMVTGPRLGLAGVAAAAYQAWMRPLPTMCSAHRPRADGYIIEQELKHALQHESRGTLCLTQVLVDPADPAFSPP